MAGAGYKLFVTGDTLTAAQVNTNLMQQTIMVFANSAARTSALSAVLAEGMFSYLLDTNSTEFYDGAAWQVFGVPEVLSNKILVSPEERTTVSATAATGTVNFDASTQGVLYYTTNASANFTLNVRGSSGTSLNSILTTGDAITVVFLNTNGATPYYPTVYQVDGSAVTPKWQGGTAPTGGNASSIDAYSLTIIKTASATFTVLASQTKFA
jgi:hypothetical protein